MLGSKFPMFVAWGPELGFLYNDAYAVILGAKHPQAMGSRFEVIWKEIWSDVGPLAHRALQGEATWLEDLPLVMNRKGFDEQTWFTFSYSPVRGDDGQIAGMFCAVAETTEKVIAQRRVADENLTLEQRVAQALADKQVYADIVESTDAFVQMADPEFNFLAINKASADEFERIFGIRPKVGDNMLALLADKPEHRSAVESVWSRALAGEEFTEIAAFGDPALDRRHYEMKYNSLRDEDGRVIAAYQFVYDVTDRIRDLERLRDAEEALRQSQKMEAVGQLVSGLAHDFNNVLGAVVAAFDMIRRRGDDPERVSRFAEAGIQAAKRGAKLTSQLLAFSRTQRIELTPLFVCDVIEKIEDLLARTLGPLIELDLALNPEPVAVLADATQVEMTVLNLALNARDAMPEGGQLFIGTAVQHIAADPELEPGKYIELTIRDTGQGMDEDTLRKALDPFFTTKPVGKGTGLGLAQVYGSARQSGGTVRIDSKLGRGTTVRVFFPATDQAATRHLHENTAAHKGPSKGGLVLLIDDDEDLRSIVSSALNSLGYEVVTAADGPSGLNQLLSSRPDVLVVDFAMPGMNGAEVAKQARELCPNLPVVLASGYANTDAIERAIGKDGKILRKPFRIDELLAAVAEATGEAASSVEVPL
ncbi:PAS domain-containing protein [Sphingomonas sp. NSE70-1]|uniref:histidine kinase n=1 Tax=Sphingomonas caseinilyticus TaxID=2908205 RepID=A0ABT0RWV2_9SPHN|nr:PAS domain-containing protein [Sphingomonas caseinilyticus]MCL6699504.1 PAS domain-containing protein [Sphingomonas caseinilyticus]